jgi:branched-chain amino acid transport system permease protein
MRMSGLSAGIATLALLLIAQVVIAESEGWTRGPQTLIGIPDAMSLWHALAAAVALSAIVVHFQYSRTGRLLRASRDDQLAAESLGISWVRHRTHAFVLSAGICGAGGGMLAYFQQSLSPSMGFFLGPTFSVIVMLIIGGMHSFGGAVLGVVVVSALQEVLRQLGAGIALGGWELSLPVGVEPIILGVVTLVMLTFRPEGLRGSKEWILVRPRYGSAPSDVPQASVADAARA